MNWVLLPLRRYAEFAGRARRLEFWSFFLFTIVLEYVIDEIEFRLGLDSWTWGVFGPIHDVFLLAILVPTAAVSVRRFHDIDRSGWLLLGLALPSAVFLFALAIDNNVLTLLAAVPALISWLALMLFFAFYGTPGSNRFGEDPKA